MESWIESSDEVNEGPCQAVETAPLVIDSGCKKLMLKLYISADVCKFSYY